MQHQEPAIGSDAVGADRNQFAGRRREILDDVFGPAAHNLVRSRAADDAVEHRERPRPGVAAVARDAGKARLKHQDADTRPVDCLAAVHHRHSICPPPTPCPRTVYDARAHPVRRAREAAGAPCPRTIRRGAASTAVRAGLDPHQPFAREDSHRIPGVQAPGDIDLEPVDEWQSGKRRALHHDGVGAIEQQRGGRHGARTHLAKHPRRGDAALGGVEHQDPPDVTLAAQGMGRAGEDPPDAIQIVAGAEVVAGDQRHPRYRFAEPGMAAEFLAGGDLRGAQYRPRTAASTQASMGAMTGS